MSIAVCFSGFYRPGTSGLESFKKHFMDVNKNYSIDIYTCTWDIDGTRVPSDHIEDERYDDVCVWSRVCNRLDQKKIDYEKYISDFESLGAARINHQFKSFDLHSEFWMKNLKPRTWQLGKTRHQAISKTSMWYGIQEAYNMIPNPEEYDFIVRTRTDNMFADDVIIEPQQDRVGPQLIPFQNMTPVGNPHIQKVMHLCKIPDVAGGGSSVVLPIRTHDANQYMDDMFAIGRPHAMQVYCGAYKRINEFFDIFWPWPYDPIESESIMVGTLMSSGVHINPFVKLPALYKG